MKKKLNKHLLGIKYQLPFTYPSEIKRLIPKGSKILDIGCGDGYLMSWINVYGDFDVYGFDINRDDLALAKKRKCLLNPRKKVYRKITRADLTKKLPNEKYDVVLSSQFVEHLDQKTALTLLSKLEKLSTKKVIIATINGFFQFNHRTAGKYDVHRSGWSFSDFEIRGYRVFGQGLRWVYIPGSFVESLPKFMRYPFYALSYLLSPLIRYSRNNSLLLIAVKDIMEHA